MEPNEVGLTHEDYMKFMKQLVETSRFAARETTIAAAMEIAVDRGFVKTDGLKDYEDSLRSSVPLAKFGE